MVLHIAIARAEKPTKAETIRYACNTKGGLRVTRVLQNHVL